MRQAHPSHLPSLIIPCPVCAGRMAFHSDQPTEPDFGVQDSLYTCKNCGAELVRTAMRAKAPAGSVAAASAGKTVTLQSTAR